MLQINACQDCLTNKTKGSKPPPTWQFQQSDNGATGDPKTTTNNKSVMMASLEWRQVERSTTTTNDNDTNATNVSDKNPEMSLAKLSLDATKMAPSSCKWWLDLLLFIQTIMMFVSIPEIQIYSQT